MLASPKKQEGCLAPSPSPGPVNMLLPVLGLPVESALGSVHPSCLLNCRHGTRHLEEARGCCRTMVPSARGVREDTQQSAFPPVLHTQLDQRILAEGTLFTPGETQSLEENVTKSAPWLGPDTRCCSGHQLGRALSGAEAQVPRLRASPSGRQGFAGMEQSLKEGALRPPGSHVKRGKKPSSRQRLPHSLSAPSKHQVRTAAPGSMKHRLGPGSHGHMVEARGEQCGFLTPQSLRPNEFSLVLFLISNRCSGLEGW